MKKTTKVFLIIVIVWIIIIILGEIYLITTNSKKDAKYSNSKIEGQNLIHTTDLQNILIDETKLRESVNEALIGIAKESETSETGYYAKYFELGRVTETKKLDIYVWAQYGTTTINKKEQSGTSIPIKLTFEMDSYSLVSKDVPPDNTNYMQYFSVIADKLEGIDYKNKDESYGQTCYRN